MTPELKAKIIQVTSMAVCYLGQIPLMGWLMPISMNMGKDAAYQAVLEQANITLNDTQYQDTYDDVLAQERLKSGLIIGAVVAVATIPSYCPYAKQKLTEGLVWTKDKVAQGGMAVRNCIRPPQHGEHNDGLLGGPANRY